MIFLIGPRFGALRGSVRFVANSADETAVGGGHYRLSCVSSDLGGGLCVIERVVGLSHDWRVSPASGATELELAKAEMLRKTRLLPELF